jgi:hypothetical protein
MTCGAVGAVRSKAAAHPVAGSCIFDPSLLLGDQALHELGPFHSPCSKRVLPFPHSRIRYPVIIFEPFL